MKTLNTYRCKIKLRHTYNGNPLKPNVAGILDDKVFDLMCCWQFDKDEKYAGEYALEPDRNDSAALAAFKEADLMWIASGDIELIQEEVA